MVYESFQNSKNRFQKTWERSQENENDLKDIPLVTLDFNSINFTKKIITIPILTNQVAVVSSNVPASILLKNFPEWSLNMIEVFVTYTIGDGFVSKFIPITLSEAFNNGTLKDGDVAIQNQDFHYWFNRVDNTNILVKVFYTINIQEANVSQIGFSGVPVPTFINLSLKILNQRIYEVMNEKKE